MNADEPIDAVYTWVDVSDEDVRRWIARSGANNEQDANGDTHGTWRFRDNGELRYSLRSLDKYAPWIRNIHIVTGQAPPYWLDTDHPRIRVVRHEEIFDPDAHLPSFNSHAIESRLARIPSLSRRFLYFNDDLFLGAPCHRQDFLHDDGIAQYYCDNIPVPTDPDNGPVHDRAYAHTLELARRYWRMANPMMLPAHTPQLFDRETLLDLEHRFEAEFLATASNRFRSPEDVVIRILYFHCLQSESYPRIKTRMFESGDPDYALVRLTPDAVDLRRTLARIRARPPKFLCLNDELPDDEPSRKTLALVRALLANVFPEPSAFEINPPSRSVAFQREMWNERIERDSEHAAVGSRDYGERFNTWIYRMKRRNFRRAVRALGNVDRECEILDAGSGTGIYLGEWSKLGFDRLTAMDVSDAAIRVVAGRYPDTRRVRASISELPRPLQGRRFRVVSAIDVLFHIVDDDDYRNAIRGIGEILDDDGIFLFTENLLRDSPRRHDLYFNSRTRSHVERCLAECGLEIVSVKPFVRLLGSPVNSRIASSPERWDRLVRFSVRHGLAGALGAVFYALDRMLELVPGQGLSTRIITCRKKTGTGS